MKRQFLKVYPLLVILSVGALLLGVQSWDQDNPNSPSPFQRIEWMSEDWRAQIAFRHPAPNSASNLVAVTIDEPDLEWMNRVISRRPRWPFGHLYYGPFVSELRAQGVEAVAFDVFFSQPDDPQPVSALELTGTTNRISGSAHFAEQMRAAGNVILAAGTDWQRTNHVQLPTAELATNAWAVGHASAHVDRDGIFRRLPVFRDSPNHGRVWCLGFVLAARHLGLDLRRAEIGPGRLVLRGEGGLVREVPLTARNEIHFDWVVHPVQTLPAQRIRAVSFQDVFTSALRRGNKREIGPDDLALKDKLVVVGASGQGVNVYDRGPTALNRREAMFLGHVNVANSLITGRFVQRLSSSQEAACAFALALVATLASWRMRTLWASLTILLLAGAYVGLAVWLYVAHRYLLPVALPVLGALLTTHLVMTVGRGVENADRRHLEQLLKKVVSPRIIDALLQLDSPVPQTRRMELTVLFADLRGFTRYSEESQTRAEAAARALNLPPEQARAFADEAAREAMNSVNRYLAAVVDQIKATSGTLDKYMGDCVMAFWGAPIADANHAAQALNCAIAAEQTMERINREFAAENQLRAQENQRRQAQGQPPLPLLPVLRLGIGLNSGLATVGFMGSEKHLSSYTAFGHIVNVASRVEGLASGGQIIATEHTVLAAGRNHPELLARCAAQSPVLVKGINTPVKTFEVQWQEATPGEASSMKA